MKNDCSKEANFGDLLALLMTLNMLLSIVGILWLSSIRQFASGLLAGASTFKWRQLAALELNGNDPVCDNDGEQWQYLVSVIEKDQTISHQFRHRCHPKTKEHEYQNIRIG
ncbi:hypothetical protein I6M49_22245 [Shewanella algae]|uniref:hypothetical protein n=1 Tax=Shewanella algae TaxID=38313 RepID=UPI001AACBC54|nr:hypothetical protein [Shewanella algae]MBO2656167.1 hypothetical protein [Shewanella algae]